MTSEAPARLEDPYVGPVSFRLGDALYGRDREREDLLDLLIAERIVLLYSPSGAGKSSLIEAALVPALREAGFEVLPTIRVTHSLAPEPGAPEPRNRYVLGTLLSLEEGVSPEKQRPIAELANITLREYLGSYADRDGRPGNEVLIFDQFEEILTADPTDEPAKHAFFKELGEMLRDRSHWALFSMREDFLAALDPYLKYLPTRLRTTFRLDLLSVSEALEAIRRPAQLAGVDFTEEAAQQLVDDLRTVRVQRPTGITEVLGSYVEPVQLQVACHLLWSMLPPDATEITPADVYAIGQVDQALAGYYADQIGVAAERTGVPERVIRDWFDERLITPQGLRSQVLEGPAASTGDGHSLMGELLDSHLVRAETRRHATWYELAHDRLIEPVRRDNAAWRAQHLSIVERAAMLWEQESKPDRLLLLGADLIEAEQDESVREGSPSQREREFLDASRRADAQVQRDAQTASALRRSARRLWIAVGLTTLLAVTSTVFLWQSVAATASAARQETAARLLLGAQENIDSDHYLAAALALEGVERLNPDDVEMARSVLYEAAQSPVVQMLRGEDDPTSFAVLSEDGSTVVTASPRAIQLWDRANGERGASLALEEGDVVNSMDVNADASTVVAGLDDGTLIVWDVAEAVPVRWTDDTGLVWSVDLSPDETRVVTVGGGNVMRMWSAGGELQDTLVAPGSAEAYSAVFSPDGRQLATSSELGEVLIWDVASGEVTGRLVMPNGERPWKVWFGADSNSVATYTSSAVTVWDLSTGSERYPPKDVISDDYDMSADLSQALEIDSWGMLTVYDMETGTETARSYVPGATLFGAAFDVEPGQAFVLEKDAAAPTFWRLEPFGDDANAAVAVGDSVFTVWNDGSLRRWGVADGALGGHVIESADATDVYDLGADASGDRLIGMTYDGRVRVWDASTGALLAAPVLSDGYYFTAAALTPDGRKMVLADSSGFVSVWDVATGAEEQLVYDGGDIVDRVVVSRDGDLALLAFADVQGQESPAVIAPVSGVGDPVDLMLVDADDQPSASTIAETVTSAAFDLDGGRVTAGTSEGRLVTFDTATGARKGSLVAHQGEVGEVTLLEPSTGLLLTIGEPSAFQYYSAGTQVVLVDSKRRSVRIVPSRDDLTSAMVTSTPDGDELVLFTVDGAIRSIPLDDGELLDLVRGKVDRELTSGEACYYASVDC